MRKGEGEGEDEGGGGGRKGRKTPTITYIWKIFYSYTNPNGKTWYSERRSFVNSPIPFNSPFSYVGHIIVGDAHTQLPTNAIIIGNDLRWTQCLV